ncbi:asparaginase [Motilibacter sp. E257]|uniref:Asparaginase n=1 Tax=Motilibacter deserti TaxID=2714956 RepID=A0ABX0GZV9_9ACTN|nr:asparaginase [Motilibacter deserti]
MASAADTDLPNVTVLDAGGTIVSSAVGRNRWQSYGGPRVTIRDIKDRISPEIDGVADVTIKDTGILGSSAATTAAELLKLTKMTDAELARPDVDAVVINTGTNIMEELAYWSDLTVRSPKPVVFTGAMRQQNTFSFDGLANLFNAITLAASEKTTCFGTVLLMNDVFFAAREVTKTDAVRTDTFEGGRLGALGMVDELKVRTLHAPARVQKCGTAGWATPFDLTDVEAGDLAKAEIVYSYLEADGEPVAALAEDADVDGIVTAGHGAGGISTEQSALRAAAIANEDVVFVSTTRTGDGSVYVADGTRNIIGGQDLTPQKARVLLQLALTFTKDPEQIRAWFKTVGSPEFDLSGKASTPEPPTATVDSLLAAAQADVRAARAAGTLSTGTATLLLDRLDRAVAAYAKNDRAKTASYVEAFVDRAEQRVDDVALRTALVKAGEDVLAALTTPGAPAVVTAADTPLPNVTILDAGGTITSSAVARHKWQTYGGPGITIKDVYDRISPEITTVADVTIVPTGIAGSSARTTAAELVKLTKMTDAELAKPDVDAVVINTGTNIMEELAYWSDLTVRSQKPVVFTGAMRQQNTFSFDGLANLFNAVTLAASQKTTCFGTVLLLNDVFFAAREVTKTDAVRTDTFEGGRLGALGMVDEDRVRTLHGPARVTKCGTDEWATPFDLSAVEGDDLAKAEIVYSYLEADSTPIEVLARSGVDGIVTAGHGAGGISTSQSIERAAAVRDEGTVFVSTTRTGDGSVYVEGTPNVIGGLDLTPQKARVLLQLGLTFSKDPEQVRTWFSTIGSPEFDLSD